MGLVINELPGIGRGMTPGEGSFVKTPGIGRGITPAVMAALFAAVTKASGDGDVGTSPNGIGRNGIGRCGPMVDQTARMVLASF